MEVNILRGIQNFLRIISDNWMNIIVIIAMIITIVKKAKVFFGKSNDEKVSIAKKQIQEIILKLVTDAEVDYLEWSKAGSIKRAQVIEKIFTMYPVLSKIANQEGLIVWIDAIIDESLETMREIFADNDDANKELQSTD